VEYRACWAFGYSILFIRQNFSAIQIITLATLFYCCFLLVICSFRYPVNGLPCHREISRQPLHVCPNMTPDPRVMLAFVYFPILGVQDGGYSAGGSEERG
jgi:hypothetical protein